MTPELLAEVFPEATRFSGKGGDPPVRRAYRAGPSGEEVLAGYAFVTSDLPPEVIGYLGPIRVLVGMDVGGTLTGVRVLWHREPLSSALRNFLQDPFFLRQFADKHVGEPFRLRTDLSGISGATVSVAALAQAVRTSSRRVASAYRHEREPGAGAGGAGTAAAGHRGPEEWASLSWFELVAGGLVSRLEGAVDGAARIEIFFAPTPDRRVAEVLLGPTLLERVLRRAGTRSETDHVFFLALDGQNLAWFRPHLFFVVQGSDTVRAARDDVVLFEDVWEGKAAGQVRAAGIWMLDRRVDVSRPFTVGFGGELGLAVASVEHRGTGGGVAADEGDGRAGPGARMAAEAGPEPAAEPPTAQGPSTAPEPSTLAESDSARDESPSPGGAELPGVASPEPADREGDARAPRPAPSPAAPPGDAQAEAEAWEMPDFHRVEEESLLARTLARTSWARVGGLLMLLAAATLAFATRSTPLRVATLAGTLLFLGFVDRGFLSVSHISSGIVVGPGLFLADLSLLILVVFTVATTLFWGRVFCGYLCPFGVLQDLLDRVVPKRFRWVLGPRAHAAGLRVKYVILAVILLPAVIEVAAPRLLPGHVSLYQYFEPFGTVFYRSPSVLLWAIALAFLTASAVVPRFYCRYACPLGAALAVGSRLAPFRIRRVEQCTVCTVCERSCPTGAIRRHEVDFPECVRCSVCEVKLIEKAGTCRHDMEDVRPRLVQLRTSSGALAGPVAR